MIRRSRVIPLLTSRRLRISDHAAVLMSRLQRPSVRLLTNTGLQRLVATCLWPARRYPVAVLLAVKSIGRLLSPQWSSSQLVCLERDLFVARVLVSVLGPTGESGHKDVARTVRQTHSTTPQRIGIIGPLWGNTLTPPSFLDYFKSSPEQLSVYFLGTPPVDYRHPGSSRIVRNPPLSTNGLREISDLITQDHIDVLVLACDDLQAAVISTHLKAIGSPVRLLNLCFGSSMIPAETGAVNLLAQPQIDYELEGDQAGTIWSRGRRLDVRFRAVQPYYDNRGLAAGNRSARSSRSVFLLTHGRLVKLTSLDFLDTATEILSRHSDVTYLIVGPGTARERQRILGHFKDYGLVTRVHLEGNILNTQGSLGNPGDSGRSLRDALREASVYLNPWPIGGGASMFEAYLAGCPVMHLAASGTPKSVHDLNRTWVEIPALRTSGWVASPTEYVERASLLLEDLSTRQRLIAEQTDIAVNLASSTRWWQYLLSDIAESSQPPVIPIAREGLPAHHEGTPRVADSD